MSRRDSARRTSLIAAREIRERGGTRAFRISTVAVVLLVVGGVLLPALLVGGTKTYRVGLTGSTLSSTSAALQVQARATGRHIRVTTYPTAPAGEQAVRDRKVDVLLVDGQRLEWRRQSDATLAALVANAVQAAHVQARAAELGLTTADVTSLLAPVPLSNATLGTTGGVDERMQVVALVTVVLTFVAVSTYGSLVLTGVVQEKSNRVGELLLARMPARELLAGKVLGIGALGLAQFALVVAVGATTMRLAHSADIPSVPLPVFTWLVVWFVLGYALYSVVYAGLGALASRLEDAQTASAPVTTVLVLCYVSAFVAMDDPSSTGATVLSLLPPTAPFVMPLRLALGAAPAWQALLAVALLLATVYALVRVSGRLYVGGMLRFGPRIRLRDAWRASTG